LLRERDLLEVLMFFGFLPHSGLVGKFLQFIQRSKLTIPKFTFRELAADKIHISDQSSAYMNPIQPDLFKTR